MNTVDLRECPACGKSVKKKAILCKYCKSALVPLTEESAGASDQESNNLDEPAANQDPADNSAGEGTAANVEVLSPAAPAPVNTAEGTAANVEVLSLAAPAPVNTAEGTAANMEVLSLAAPAPVNTAEGTAANVEVLSLAAPAPVSTTEVSTGDLRECPFCGEVIKAKAIVCRFCRSQITVDNKISQSAEVPRITLPEALSKPGGNLERVEKSAQPPEPKSKKTIPAIKVLLLTATALMVLAAGALFLPSLNQQPFMRPSGQKMEQPRPAAGEERAITGSFNEIKALELLYGKYDPALKGVFRKSINLSDEMKSAQLPDSGISKTVMSKEYQEEGKLRHLLVSRTRPEDYTCQACAPIVSAAIFMKSGEKWVLASEFYYLPVGGQNGEPPSLTWQKIGKGYALQFMSTETNQEHYQTEVGLLDLSGKYPQEILRAATEFAENKKQEVILNFKRSEKEYWDAFLKVSSDKQNSATTRYVYENGSYVAKETVTEAKPEPDKSTKTDKATKPEGSMNTSVVPAAGLSESKKKKTVKAAKPGNKHETKTTKAKSSKNIQKKKPKIDTSRL